MSIEHRSQGSDYVGILSGQYGDMAIDYNVDLGYARIRAKVIVAGKVEDTCAIAEQNIGILLYI